MITTDDGELADRIRRFNSLGYAAVGAGAGKGKITRDTIQDPLYERHATIGFNYRMAELCAAVALGQLERLEELVAVRQKVAAMYEEAREGCRWLVPQKTPPGYVHSYWTYVLKLESGVGFSWHDFRDRYRAMGGDGVYAAWRLTHAEPAFRGARFGDWQSQDYQPGLCPVAEALQPRLFQFKTNYFDLDRARRAADALRKTIRDFGS